MIPMLFPKNSGRYINLLSQAPVYLRGLELTGGAVGVVGLQGFSFFTVWVLGMSGGVWGVGGFKDLHSS